MKMLLRRTPSTGVGLWQLRRRAALVLALTGLAVAVGLAAPSAADASSAGIAGLSSAGANTAVLATAADVVPMTSGQQCINILRTDPPQICFEIFGTGLYVDQFEVWVDSGYAVGKFEVFGPNGYTRWSTVRNVEGGGHVFFNVYRYLPAGKYCGRYWNENPNGSFTNKGTVCASVHA